MEERHDEIIIYQSQDGPVKVDVLFENETVWLTQQQMALLFQKDISVISRHIKNMKNHFKNLLEPIGLAILLVAFVWQMRSVYVNQSIQNDKIYKFEKAIDYILECEVDEALRDSTRYKGEAIMNIGYDGIKDFSEAFYEDSKGICEKKDKANYAWWWQFALYIVGSACVIGGKVWNNYEKDNSPM